MSVTASKTAKKEKEELCKYIELRAVKFAVPWLVRNLQYSFTREKSFLQGPQKKGLRQRWVKNPGSEII
jgi:hypothetical protein